MVQIGIKVGKGYVSAQTDSLSVEEANKVRSCAYHINRLLGRHTLNLNLIGIFTALVVAGVGVALFYVNASVLKITLYSAFAGVIAFFLGYVFAEDDDLGGKRINDWARHISSTTYSSPVCAEFVRNCLDYNAWLRKLLRQRLPAQAPDGPPGHTGD